MGNEILTSPPAPVNVERKLVAILSADVAGYSRLMGADEVGTLRTLTAYRKVTDTLIQQHHGRIVSTAGDSILAEFASAVDAVQCAVEIQHALKDQNAALPAEQRMEFRIGINVGDVVVEGEQIYGDGVNVAARIQSLADAGGVFLSGTVYDQIENKLSLTYEYLGEQPVKNITKPVRVYRIRLEESSSHKSSSPESKGKSHEPRRAGIARLKWMVAGLLLMAAAIVTVRYFSFLVPNPQPLAPSTQPSLSPQSSALITQAPLPLPDKPSIVVLPFDNMSKDPEQEYFSNGITEVLTSDLSRISSLLVIARNTAFTYKGKATNVQAISKELGVRYVLEGSVQRAGDQVRIVVQLIDTTTGEHLWSERFDRPFKDIFALQDELVQKIVTTLKLQLTLMEQGYLVRKHTNNLDAYDAFLRGQEHFWRFTKEATAQARQLWEKAVALDPQYAEAYAFLGWTYWTEWIFRWSAAPQNLERAFELAQQAIALDDFLPRAHSLVSNVYALKQQYDPAVAEGERAIALDPNNADSYAFQAQALNFAGRPEEALWMVEQAMRLNPHYPPLYLFELGWAYRLIGRYAEAVTMLKEFISQSPNFPPAHFHLAASYVQQWAFQHSPDSRILEQALAAAQRLLALNDSFPPGHQNLGYVYLWQKQYEQALAETERAVALGPNEAFGYALLAEVLSRVGKAEEALEAAEQALHLKPLTVDAHLDSVGAAYDLAGKPEKAIAPLKQFLSRYPNILGAHLTLAAVYSELGKEAEARAEAAEVLRINPQFSLEVHKERTPIKDPSLLERHIAALRKAGLK
jgi:TolB-like protein/class 3 adenylate cyclase/Tfp pilus assembly protein PilF